MDVEQFANLWWLWLTIALAVWSVYLFFTIKWNRRWKKSGYSDQYFNIERKKFIPVASCALIGGYFTILVIFTGIISHYN